MSSEVWFQTNIVLTSTPDSTTFYGGIGFLSCSFDRITREKSWVGMRIMKYKSLERLWNETSLFNRAHAVRMSDQRSRPLDMINRQYTKMAKFWSDKCWLDVGWNVVTVWHVHSTIHKTVKILVRQMLGRCWVKQGFAKLY